MSRKFVLLIFLLSLIIALPVSGQDEKPFEGRTITFVTVQPHAVASRYVADLFEQETGATVDVYVVPYDTIAEQAVLDVTSGVGIYDVIEIWYPTLGYLASNGVLVEITDWWEENADIIDAEDFAPTISEPYTLWDGRRWAVPYDGDTHILFYNAELFERYGIENPPTNWDEYLEISRIITEAGAADGVYGSAIMGAQIPLILIGTYVNRLGGYGGSFFDEDGNPSINSPEAVAALEALLAQSPYALPTPASTAFDEAVGGFVTGQVALIEFWTDLGQIADNPEGSDIVDQWRALPMLAGTGPNARVAPALNAGFSVGISTLASDPEVAEAFLLFIARPDVNVAVNTIVGGLDPTRISTFDDPRYREHVTPELADTARAALTAATAWPTDPQWPELQEVLTENLAAALAGTKSAQQALDDTQSAWEEILGR